MKMVHKIIAILIIAVCAFGIMPSNMSMAAGGSSAADIVSGVTADTSTAGNYATDLQGKVGKLLGFLQIAAGLLSIVMIAFVGFNYITATPDVKKELQTKMLPIVIGLVLVFGAVSVARFILGVVG